MVEGYFKLMILPNSQTFIRDNLWLFQRYKQSNVLQHVQRLTLKSAENTAHGLHVSGFNAVPAKRVDRSSLNLEVRYHEQR